MTRGIARVTTVVAHVMRLQTGESQDRVVFYPADAHTQQFSLRLYQEFSVFAPAQHYGLVPVNNGAKQRKSLIYLQCLLGITRILQPGWN